MCMLDAYSIYVCGHLRMYVAIGFDLSEDLEYDPLGVESCLFFSIFYAWLVYVSYSPNKAHMCNVMSWCIVDDLLLEE